MASYFSLLILLTWGSFGNMLFRRQRNLRRRVGFQGKSLTVADPSARRPGRLVFADNAP